VTDSQRVDQQRVGQIASRRQYTGRVINLDIDQVRFPNGKVGELEMIRHSGASAVLPFLGDPAGDDPTILLIRQYRYAADGFIYEIPAGRLEAGEPPEACAVRELREETGCTAAKMEHLYTMYTTPGFTDEKIHLFVATGVVRGESALEQDEFVEVVPTTMSAALRLIKDGTINDAKTALSILYVAGFFLGR
jgi:ADP-ribose pyrophosphatase